MASSDGGVGSWPLPAITWPRCSEAPGGRQWLLWGNQTLTESFCSDGSRRQSSWHEEAEVAMGARRYPPSWPVASMAPLIKVNGPVLVELISFSPAWPASWRRPGLPAAETWSMRGTPGPPDVLGVNLQPHRSLALATKRVTFSIQFWGWGWAGGSGSSFISSEGK